MYYKPFILVLLGLCISCSGYAQEDYENTKSNTKKKRLEFNEKYQSAQTEAERQEVIEQARIFLLKDIDNYFKTWYNTQWDFNGHTRTPRNGKIACGYFVTTILSDMDFNIPRVKWAQLASEDMIKYMTTDIKRFRNKPMADIVDYIKDNGEGLYVVGLDRHVGYIYYNNDRIQFVHSNYYRPQIGVMSENLIGRNPLNDSKYKIIGKILHDNMVQKWITGGNWSK